MLFGGGGSGGIVELLAKMENVTNIKKALYQFFWKKPNIIINTKSEQVEEKGFAQLKKNEDPAREEDWEKEKDKLLISDKRVDDIHSKKLDWNDWFWDDDRKVQIGVPGVKQKSWCFTCWMRN